jgi:hypothetical protein
VSGTITVGASNHGVPIIRLEFDYIIIFSFTIGLSISATHTANAHRRHALVSDFPGLFCGPKGASTCTCTLLAVASLRSVIAGFIKGDIINSFRKLEPDDPVHFLWENFWDKSIELEESEWRGENTGMLDAHVADVEQSDEEDIVDYKRGCYVLKLNLKLRLRVTKIWVRAEYLLLYEAIEEYYKDTIKSPSSSAVVLTGQPGCGEFIAVLTLVPA